MINIFSKYQLIFYLSNIFLLIEYFFHGSLIGCIIYGDCKIQPQLTPNFIISSNHFYAFFLLTFIGFIAYKKSNKLNFLTLYLINLAVFLEISHFFISYRNFELSDLFGNLLGILVVVFISNLISKYESYKK